MPIFWFLHPYLFMQGRMRILAKGQWIILGNNLQES